MTHLNDLSDLADRMDQAGMKDSAGRLRRAADPSPVSARALVNFAVRIYQDPALRAFGEPCLKICRPNEESTVRRTLTGSWRTPGHIELRCEFTARQSCIFCVERRRVQIRSGISTPEELIRFLLRLRPL